MPAPRQDSGVESQGVLNGKIIDVVFAGNTAAYKSFGAETCPSFSCHGMVKPSDVGGDIERLKHHMCGALVRPLAGAA